jgi:Sulfatase-modifying factor enzyme 1/CHAT domain
MDAAILEISLQQISGGATVADVRFQPPASMAIATLATSVAVPLDPTTLIAAALDGDDYGHALTSQLFAPQELRLAWEQARSAAFGAGATLRVHLHLDLSADILHRVWWETLRDPGSDAPLALHEQILLTRTLASSDLTPIIIPTRPELRALVVAASPTDLTAFGLSPIDVVQEATRVTTALAPIQTQVIGAVPGAVTPRAALPAIVEQLRTGHQILYLVAHGTLAGDEPYLWLEQEDGTSDRVSGRVLAERLSALAPRPLLVLLASCMSGGAGLTDAALAALGPRLARAGIAAVVGMQGRVPAATIARLVPALFRELQRDGQIDRALAAARTALRGDAAWWMPALWLRVRDGRLWSHEPPLLDRRAAQQELAAFLTRVVAAHQSWLNAALPRRPRPAARPYRALLAFGVEDAARFFGRDQAVDALQARVAEHQLVVVHGRSGAGKSSLLHAGLVPRLFDEGWLPLVIRSGAAPLLSLRDALAPPSLGIRPALLDSLRLPDLLGLLCREALPSGKRLLLVIDQAEELFTSQPDVAAREAFAHDLAGCLNDPQLPTHFLLSIRGDHLSDLDQLARLLPAILDQRYLVMPLSRAEAEEAIVRPLGLLQPPHAVEPALLAELLDDLERGGMELPHLQILCTRLFDALETGERVLTASHYRRLGGSPGILGSYLRHEVERLGPDLPLARALLFALVSPQRSRLQRTRPALREHLAHRHDHERIDAVLAALVEARLLRQDDRAEGTSFELTHDYLIGEILSWVTPEDLDARRARDALDRGLTSWREHHWPLDAPSLDLIHAQRELLAGLSTDDLALLLQSAAAQRRYVEVWAPAAHRIGLDIWPILQPLLGARDLSLRAATVVAIATLGEAAIPTLVRALADKAPPVRTQAILALARMPDESGWSALRDGLRHEILVPGGDGLPPLCIDRFPVTNGDYGRFLRANPAHPRPAQWANHPPPRDQLHDPVTGVSWHDAMAYAAWAGRVLPTAAEWQRAAGWPARRYPWGEQMLPGSSNTREVGLGGVSPVGRFSPRGDSPWGAGDMAGNVWEWLVDTVGPGSSYRALRGGAWRYSGAFAASDYDGFCRPPDHCQDTIGFRLCLNLGEERVL